MKNVLKREANLPLKCLRIPLICRFTTATPSTCLSGNNDNAFHLFVCEFHLYAVLQRQRRPLLCLRKHLFVWKQRQRLPLICLRSNAFHLFVCEATATATRTSWRAQKKDLLASPKKRAPPGESKKQPPGDFDFNFDFDFPTPKFHVSFAQF